MERILTFTLPLFYGRGIFQERWTIRNPIWANIWHVHHNTCYSFGMMPHRHPITVVVGTPIPVEKLSTPTPDQGSPNWQTFLKGRGREQPDFNCFTFLWQINYLSGTTAERKLEEALSNSGKGLPWEICHCLEEAVRRLQSDLRQPQLETGYHLTVHRYLQNLYYLMNYKKLMSCLRESLHSLNWDRVQIIYWKPYLAQICPSCGSTVISQLIWM